MHTTTETPDALAGLTAEFTGWYIWRGQERPGGAASPVPGRASRGGFTAPHMGGRGRYIAVVPAGTIPGESREVTVSAMDLTSLMDQLDDKFGSLPGAS